MTIIGRSSTSGTHPRRANFLRALKTQIKSNPVFYPLLSLIFGTGHSGRHFLSKAFAPYLSIARTGELHNFTYDITEPSRLYLAEMISVVTARPPDEIARFIREPREDEAMAKHLSEAMSARRRRGARHSGTMPFGRRLGWYAIARATKPRIIVETGVERGHGAVLLCSALMRNAQEGFEGRYFGTDINPDAGWLLSGVYKQFGEILYGDSKESLAKFNQEIDLFINDSDHSATYEAEEYQTIKSKLSSHAIILGDNAHVTDKLARFARETGRRFVYFRETPADHWYPGGGIGMAFPAQTRE
jgi:predicted O-methyltransferase YrrM